ncbi:VOC family protein [Pseudonocardia sp. CA-107938]|uniref:VOC family protein n=1 Tax=Pseudonocardia sp. CA-107938 TaxID=3240021 RepID=UPI003D91BF39
MLVYPDVRAAVDWLADAFGFVERVRVGVDHRSQLQVGDDGAVIVADASGERQPPDGAVTHEIKVRVADVDAAFERARAYGAQVLEAPVDREYGERECTVVDLAGHRWQFTRTIRDVAPAEWGGGGPGWG